jgi:hypothetical protein
MVRSDSAHLAKVVDTQDVASDVPPGVPWFAANHFSDPARMAIAVSSALAVNGQALSICSSHPFPSSLSMPAPPCVGVLAPEDNKPLDIRGKPDAVAAVRFVSGFCLENAMRRREIPVDDVHDWL